MIQHQPECAPLLAGPALPRVVLELSEHDQVADNDAMGAVLAPLLAAGMRLAAEDPVLRTLVHSLVDFGHGCDGRVVAAGVGTAADAARLLDLGVDYGQGWHFGRLDRRGAWSRDTSRRRSSNPSCRRRARADLLARRSPATCGSPGGNTERLR